MERTLAVFCPLDTEMSRAIERTAARLLPGVPFTTTVSTATMRGSRSKIWDLG